jgi:hypothetical protein
VCNEDIEARVFLFLITSERLIALREKFVKMFLQSENMLSGLQRYDPANAKV